MNPKQAFLFLGCGYIWLYPENAKNVLKNVYWIETSTKMVFVIS